jgi:hypothetical protein
MKMPTSAGNPAPIFPHARRPEEGPEDSLGIVPNGVASIGVVFDPLADVRGVEL